MPELNDEAARQALSALAQAEEETMTNPAEIRQTRVSGHSGAGQRQTLEVEFRYEGKTASLRIEATFPQSDPENKKAAFAREIQKAAEALIAAGPRLSSRHPSSVRRSASRIPGDMEEAAVCHQCRGSGQFGRAVCPVCLGFGRGRHN